MPHPLFKEAAFLTRDGEVIPTGPFHDYSLLSDHHLENLVGDGGWVTHDGRYFSRDEAQAMLNSKDRLESENMLDQTMTPEQIAEYKSQVSDYNKRKAALLQQKDKP